MKLYWQSLLVFLVGCLFGWFLFFFIPNAHARDLGQWEDVDPEVRAWYKNLMMPDQPTIPCCGEADAYWCDDVHTVKGETKCTITDDRPDGSLGRPHVEIGTVIDIPSFKLKWDKGNPTGHAIVFLAAINPYSNFRYVMCFVLPGGV